MTGMNPPPPRHTTEPAGGPRYGNHVGNHVGADVVCLDCGAIVAEQAAHTRFHSILSGHAWTLAVLKTTHLSAAIHDRYEAPMRIDSKRFDSWTNDAFAEVTAAAGRGAADGDSRPDTVRFTIDGKPHQLPGTHAATSADALLRMTGLSADTHDLARVPGPREVITRLDQATVRDGDQFISIRISTGTA
jgi:hypothetical protein